MKLELKHLAPYLPYKLKVHIEDNRIYTLEGLSAKYDRVDLDDDYGWSYMGGIKLILRPLSDLNRFGEDIINEHSINLLISEKYNLDYGTFSSFKGELDIELDGDPDLRYDVNKRISFDVMLTIQEELLKGHYDIYGLIENNLAIDINTVK